MGAVIDGTRADVTCCLSVRSGFAGNARELGGGFFKSATKARMARMDPNPYQSPEAGKRHRPPGYNSGMDEKRGNRFQFGLASLFAAMTLAALAVRARWWIPVIWVAVYLCGIIALAVLVVIVRILGWAGVHIARMAKSRLRIKPRNF